VSAVTSALPTGTVTFLFTDIEGSTDLVRRLRDRYGEMRGEHERILRVAFAAHGGHVIDTQGDAFFVVFSRAASAVEAAVAVQRQLAATDWPDGARFQVRIGLHTAEPYLDGDRYVGVGVHRAARICAAGRGGQILLSSTTAGIIEDEELVELRDLGEFPLKDLPSPQRLYAVVVEGTEAELAAPTTPQRGRTRAGVTTVLITDVVGWSKLLRELGDDGAAAIAADYQMLVANAVAEHDGEILELAGDTVIAYFDRAPDAIDAAVTIRQAVARYEWRPDAAVAICAGLHTGRVVGERPGGSAIWRCMGLCTIAEPGQILVSHATEALLEGEKLDGVVLRDLGERQHPASHTPSRVFEIAGHDRL
jgi:class 3 adenylate cyclase